MMVCRKIFEALEILSRAAAVIAEGEVMQLAAMNDAQITEDRYLQIIDAKTAALFAAAAEVGGVIGDASSAECRRADLLWPQFGHCFSTD